MGAAFHTKKKGSELAEFDPVGMLIERPDINIVKVDQIPEFHNNCRCIDVNDKKKMHAFEKGCRASLEYRNYFQYLKRNLDMSMCSFLPYIESEGRLRIELHHSPFTLLEVCAAVANRQIAEHGYADEFEVCQEVMQLHYRNLIGLIPVSPTVHQLIHTEQIDVHPAICYGYWKDFIEEYREFFPDKVNEKYYEIMKWEGVPTDRVPEILKVKYVFLQYEGIPLYKNLALEDHSQVVGELMLGEAA